MKNSSKLDTNKSSKTNDDTDNRFIELNLDYQQCAEVALYMYQEWQQAMQPPIFIYKNFDQWLEELKTKEQNND